MFSLLLSTALAAELSKADCKTIQGEIKAAYPGPVWSLKDLPVNSGFTMYAAWISPIAEVSTGGVKIEVTGGISATVGSAQSVWFGVRPYDTLSLKEAECNKDGVVIAFVGTDGSKGRDTKIKIVDSASLSAVKAGMDMLVSATDPVDASWPEEVKQAIHNRTLVNGMTKRQAYLVLGEPSEATTKDENGKKVEIWKPRQGGGMRIGYGAKVENTGYPTEVRFEDGKLAGMGTGSGGGVSLD